MPSELSLNMTENSKQSLAQVNTLDKFKKDENLVKFITKTINKVVNKQMDVIEHHNQEHFRCLYMENK